MQNFENNILTKRQQYRKRRNVVRKIFLVSVLFFVVMLVGLLLSVEKKSTFRMEIYGNKSLGKECVLPVIDSLVKNKNFFFFSPKMVSAKLFDIFPILKVAKVRKYLLPDKKLLIYIKEKELWGQFNLFISNKTIKYYVTDYGDLVSVEGLNQNYIPAGLILIFSQKQISKEELMLLKRISDFFIRNLGVIIERFALNQKSELEIYTDSAIKIRAGVLKEELFEKIKMLTGVLRTVKEKAYLIEYIDLTLDKGVVIRKSNEKLDKKRALKFKI